VNAEERMRAAGFLPVERLGEGASGEVWQAIDTSRDAQVAVKVLTALEPALRRRFVGEADLAARLRHPHLVRVERLVEDAAGLFQVLELVRGPSLRARLAGGRVLTPREAAQLLAEVGSALAEAHAYGVVHRDVKPGNVLVAASGFKLCDLGLARDPDRSTRLTGTGDWLGTADYFAPEQVDGREAGAATDVFALASTCHHALTGSPPFEADAPLELARRIAFDRAPSLRLRRPDLPQDARRLLEAMHEKEPADRPTAGDVARDAERLLRDGPWRG
jgi:eukaryotic-like serine/threonine-protein kinase